MKGKKIKYRLVAKNPAGFWVNAVDLNDGGTKTFVKGPYDPSYGLGTYGVDKITNTVWAVVNHNSKYAVKKGYHYDF